MLIVYKEDNFQFVKQGTINVRSQIGCPWEKQGNKYTLIMVLSASKRIFQNQRVTEIIL
jgi:hypothetical protein